MMLKSQKGYSLIESLLCVSLTAIAACIYPVVSNMMNIHGHYAVKSSEAEMIMQNVAEDLLSLPSTSSNLLSNAEILMSKSQPFTRIFTKEGVQATDPAAAYYTVSWDVTKDVPILGARSIMLKINWKEGGNYRNLAMRVVR